MKPKIFNLFFVCLFFATSVSIAQEAQEDGFLKQFAVGAKVGTYGVGIDFHTSLLPNLKARVGFNYLDYTLSRTVSFDADAADGGQDVSGEFNKMHFKFPNANILFDFYPVKSGIFSITAGAYIGDNNIHVKGNAPKPFLWGDLVVTPDNTGYFDGDLISNVVKPYLGIGLGRTISQGKVGFRFDLGVIYQGAYNVESDYSSKNATQGSKDKFNDLDLPISDTVLDWWPLMSFSISYRIK